MRLACGIIRHCSIAEGHTTGMSAELRARHAQGDNNWGDDRALYNEGQQWLNLKHLMGRVVG